MGCCCSTEDNDSYQSSEPNERTRLLQDPVSNAYDVNTSSKDYGNHYSSSSQKNDEHSALNKVLQKTANKVIDVGAPDFQGLEEHEYNERGRRYASAINKIHISQSLLKKKKDFLLADVPGVDKILSSPPISFSDYSFMNEMTQKLNFAVDSIKIDHKEELVVGFGSLTL